MAKKQDVLHARDAESSREKSAEAWSARRNALVLSSLLGCVLLIHLLGKLGYYKGLYSFVVADTITLGALILLGTVATITLALMYDAKQITCIAALGASFMILGQAINVMDGIPAFGGIPSPATRSLLFIKEPVSAIGIVLFVGGMFWGAFEAHRARRQLLCEREALAVNVEERRQAVAELEKIREELEKRVAERTEALTEANRRLEAEILERGQAEQALRESEQRYRMVVEDETEAICRFRADGTLLFVNDVFCRFFGQNKAELLGKPWHPSVATHDLSQVNGLLQTLSPSNPVVLIENQLYSGAGEIRWMQFANRGFFDADGHLVEIQAVGRDVTERHQAEDALRESEEALRFMIETIDDVFWQMTPELRVTYVSPADERQRGYKPEEVIGRPVTDFMTPQGVETFQAWFAERNRIREEGGDPGTAIIELEQICKDGRIMWAEAVSSPILDSESRILGFQGITRDITKRKQVEEALRKSEETLRFMIGKVQDVFWQMTPELRFTYISPAVEKQQGYQPDEVVGRTLLEFLTPESAEAVSARLAAERATPGLVADANNITYEFDIRRKDGSLMRCEALPSPVRDTNGNLMAYQGVTRDITRRRTIEEALRQSEAKYRELVQSANSIILRMDDQGVVTFVNQFAQKFFGYAEDEILGRNVIGTIVPAMSSDGRDCSVMIKEIGQHPERYASNENENICKDGRRVWISWTNRPICDEDGRVKETLCIGNDVTDRVQARQMLVEQQARTLDTARLTALGTMASGIAHEINNPMAIVSVGAEQLEKYLQRQPGTDEHMINVARTITRNVARVHHIIQGLRNLSRDGAADMPVAESIRAVVADTLEVCQTRCRDAGIVLNVCAIPDDLKIECRVAQLSQVLLNLLNNAYDAVKDLPDKWIALDVADQADDVVFSITDSGHGLSEDLHEKVFMPFFTTKGTGGGIGLGLSISRRMVENHNGNLWLDTDCPNTRFVMRLPKRATTELA